MIYIAGPGHGGPGVVANTYLEGTYSEFIRTSSQDEDGHEAPVHAVLLSRRHPEPCSAGNARLDPRGRGTRLLAVACLWRGFRQPRPDRRLRDRRWRSRNRALATSWHSNKFLNPVSDGAVLPILHLNGYKIANPTVLARIPQEELVDLLHGYGYEPVSSRAMIRKRCTSSWPRLWIKSFAEIRAIQTRGARRTAQRAAALADDRAAHAQRLDRAQGRRWPPGRRYFSRPPGALHGPAPNPSICSMLEEWMRSYRPEELFDAPDARPGPAALAPKGERRMSANPHANGGCCCWIASYARFPHYAVAVIQPGTVDAEATRVLGKLLRDVMEHNARHEISASSVRTKPRPTGWMPSSKPPAALDAANILPDDDHLTPTAA